MRCSHRLFIWGTWWTRYALFPSLHHVQQWSFFTSQVGDGDADHAWWGRPEDNHMFRPTYAIGAGKPTGGADIMGESAAAMAAGSVIFKDKGKIIERKLHTLWRK